MVIHLNSRDALILRSSGDLFQYILSRAMGRTKLEKYRGTATSSVLCLGLIAASSLDSAGDRTFVIELMLF